MIATDTVQPIQAADDEFLASQRRQLLDRRDSYRQQAERLAAAAVELVDERGMRDGGDDEGFGEGDTLDVDRDQVLALLRTAQARLGDIDAALARLEDRSYGSCQTCRRPIDSARLEALPETTQCVACKSGGVLVRR